MIKFFINMFNNVNKNNVFQAKIKNIKNNENNLNNTNLYT